MLQTIFIAGILSIQWKCRLSDRTTVNIVKFVLLFLTIMAEVFVIDRLKEFVEMMPLSHDTLCKRLSLSRDDFQEYATCLDCHSLFKKADVIKGRVSVCNFVQWPQHPHAVKRQPCGATLHSGRSIPPHVVKGTYCYRSISRYLQNFVIQKGFLNDCNSWRNRVVR